MSSGAVYSLLFRLQHASHADAIKRTDPKPPVFLLGFWRSGTTLLHELFCCDSRFGFPSTYACLNPFHFLLTEHWVNEHAHRHQTRRPMDNMRYSWSSPQEDEFALLALGAPSPYEALLAPSLLLNPRTLLDVRARPQKEQERWAESLLYFQRLLTIQQSKPMMFKSPPHGFRLSLLPSLFPLARYVIIERNPYEVFASNLKLWRTLVDMYGLEPSSALDLETFVLSAYVIHEEAIAEGIAKLPPQSFAKVRYEDLIANPLQQMARVYMELNLGDFDAVRGRLEQHLESVKEHARNRFRISAAQKAKVDSAWGRIIQEKQYSWDDQYVSLQ